MSDNNKENPEDNKPEDDLENSTEEPSEPIEITEEDEAEAEEYIKILENPPEPATFTEAQGVIALYNTTLMQKIAAASEHDSVGSAKKAFGLGLSARFLPFVGGLFPVTLFAAGALAWVGSKAVRRFVADTSLTEMFDMRDEYVKKACEKFPKNANVLRSFASQVDREEHYKTQTEQVVDTAKTAWDYTNRYAVPAAKYGAKRIAGLFAGKKDDKKAQNKQKDELPEEAQDIVKKAEQGFETGKTAGKALFNAGKDWLKKKGGDDGKGGKGPKGPKGGPK